jgi:hypothetical protein
MGSGPTTRRRRRRLHQLQVSFVVITIFAAGLVSAGVVSGAGPLAVLSTGTDTSTTESTATETTTGESTTTDSTETTTTETESTESTTTETSPLPTAPPTLVSDKPDYMPGETVTLTGENWRPAEVVRIVVNDDQQQPWTHQANVVASANGSIYHQFQLPTSFAALYTATATGPISGTASTTFTDGNVKVASVGGVHFDYQVTLFNSTNCTTGGGSATTKTGDANGSTTGVGSNESLLIVANLNANAPNASATFSHWTRPDPPGNDPPVQLAAGYSDTDRTICLVGFQSGSRDLIGNYTVQQPPTIARNNASVTVNEGQTATNSGTYSDPNAGDNVTITASVGTVTKTGTNSGTWSWSFGTNDGPAESQTVTMTANDGNGGTATTTFSITVNNVAPEVTLTGPASASEGSTVSYSYTFTDPGADTWTHVTSCGANGTKSDDVFTPATKSGSFKCTWADNFASQIVSARVDDDDGGSDTDSINVTVNNVAPEVTLTGPASASEGSTVSYSYTFTDPGADTWTRTVSCGSSGTVSNSSFNSATKSGSFDCQFTDDNPTGTSSDTSIVMATVTDDDGGSDSDSINVTVSNVIPVITGMTGPSGPVAIGGAADVTTNYTDVGTADTHKCEYSWDDGDPNTTVDGSGSGTGSCTASHTYASAGVYTVGVTVTDDDTGSATSKYEFVVVFDPSAGFVTGGGWINSPAGAYAAGPSLTGRANFGFVSKYKKGASVPEGQTEFQLHFATFNFHSTAYQWLVVSANGTKAQYKGDGKLNGGGNYGFLLTAYDGSLDKFRIKIWDKGTSAIVYDNRVGASDDIDTADPQEIAGGSIVIHRGK